MDPRDTPESMEDSAPLQPPAAPVEQVPPQPPRMAPPPYRQFRSRKRLSLLLFIATCFCTFYRGMQPGGLVAVPWELLANPSQLPAGVLSSWLTNGAIYAACIMLMLLAHEMGHYLQARRYGVPATLPFFIPMPITPFGTMGAVIVQGTGVADRRALFDIAISGPLAGLVIALPLTYLGIRDAEVHDLAEGLVNGQRIVIYDNPLLFDWLFVLAKGHPLAEGQDMTLSPMLFAGWVGIFITGLNLIPVGQLDGGHILYTLIGPKARFVGKALLIAAVLFMVMKQNLSFLLMVFLLFLMGTNHPPTANDYVPLGVGRRVLGWVTLCFVLIGFTPTPIYELEYREVEPTEQIQTAMQAPKNEVKAHRQDALVVARDNARIGAIADTASVSTGHRSEIEHAAMSLQSADFGY